MAARAPSAARNALGSEAACAPRGWRPLKGVNWGREISTGTLSPAVPPFLGAITFHGAGSSAAQTQSWCFREGMGL